MKISVYKNRISLLLMTGYLVNLINLSLPGFCSEKSSLLFKGEENKYKKVLVKRVISADTIILENDEKIKFIGLKAPEPPPRPKIENEENTGGLNDEGPLSSLEERAYDFAKSLLEGKYVRLEFDVSQNDENYQTLAYVFLIENNTFVNALILSQGWANLHIRQPNIKYADSLRIAYQEARQEKRGLHGE